MEYDCKSRPQTGGLVSCLFLVITRAFDQQMRAISTPLHLETLQVFFIHVDS